MVLGDPIGRPRIPHPDGKCRVKLQDANGDTINAIEVNGRIYPWGGMDQNYLNMAEGELYKFEPRDDDIWLCAYPKCGTHWLYEILSLLQDPQREALVDSRKGQTFIEFKSPTELEQRPSPRIMNSHLLYDELKSVIGSRKVVQVLRNPKDACVSYYNHTRGINFYEYEGTLEGFVPIFLSGEIEYGSWFDYYKHWWDQTKSIPQQGLSADPKSEITRLARFLGIDVSEQRVVKIAEICGFDNMKLNKTPIENPGNFVLWRPEHTATGSTMYNKGKVGNWRAKLSQEQSDAFDRLLAERFADYPVLTAMLCFD